MLRKSYCHGVDSDFPLTDMTLGEMWKSCLNGTDTGDGKENGISWVRPNERFTIKQLCLEVK